MSGVLVGGRLADRLSPCRLALVALGGTVLGLLGTGVATSMAVVFAAIGVIVGSATGLG